MQPPTDTDNTVEHEGHPPSPLPGLKLSQTPWGFEVCVPHDISIRSSLDHPQVVQPKRDSGTSLEASLDPYFDPAPFTIEPPAKNDARLPNLEDVLAMRHGLIDVLPSLIGMELGKFVSNWPGVR